MIDLFKQHEGLNTDLMYPGAVLYMEAECEAYIGDRNVIKVIKGNIYILYSNPLSFSFKDLQGMKNNTMVEVRYDDIKSGQFRITELRALK